MRTDIGDQVRPLLGDELQEKLDEVEEVLERCVTFYEDDRLTDAQGAASPEGIIRLAPPEVANLDVIAEEIMHLHRWSQGFPAIEPQRAILGLEKSLQQLGGHFDEAAFFPFLEQLGLNPTAPIAAVMDTNRRAIEAQIPDLERNAPEHALDILIMRKRFAVTYVQAALLAPPTPERDALIQLFQQPVLAEVLLVGQSICAEIETAIPLTPDAVGQSMNRCLQSLGIDQQAARVRTFAYPMN